MNWDLNDLLSNPGVRSPDSYYLINDDMSGLTEKQKKIRQLAFNFTQKELGNKDEKIYYETIHFNQQTWYRRLWKELGKLGLLGVVVKEEYGGSGGSHLDHVIIQEELSQASLKTSLEVHYSSNTCQCIYPIYRYGTEEQKRKYLPKLCSGEHIGSGSISVFDSDFDDLSADKQADYYILNGCGIIPTTDIDILVIYAKTNPNIPFGVSAFIVDTSFEGCTLFVQNSDTCKFNLNDCKVPAINMIGRKNEGAKIAINCFDVEEVILTGVSIGFMYSSCNGIFKRMHSEGKEFIEIKEKIASMYSKLRASRNYLYAVARSYDNGHGNLKYSATVGYYCTKNATKLSFDVTELLGKTSYANNCAIKQLSVDMELYRSAVSNDVRHDAISQFISHEYSS